MMGGHRLYVRVSRLAWGLRTPEEAERAGMRAALRARPDDELGAPGRVGADTCYTPRLAIRTAEDNIVGESAS